MSRISPWFVLLIAALSPKLSLADFLLINNHSFEAATVAPGNFSTTSAPSGWSAYGNIDFNARTIGVLNPNSTTLYGSGPPDGNNVGVVFLLDNSGDQSAFANSEAGMQQTLTSTLQNNSTYTLTVQVGNISNDSSFPHNSFQFFGFPGYRVDLMAGGTILASDSSLVSGSPSEGNFQLSTVSFTAGNAHALAGQSLGIRLVNLNNSTGIEVNFDNVQLQVTAVPEPSSLLLGTSAIGMLALWRRRSKNRSVRPDITA
jgi:hypothetical protein